MKNQRRYSVFAAAVGMLLLILDGKTALQGAAEGVELCIRTLIPSLFPFFVLSAVMTNALSGQGMPFLGGVGKLCRIPKGGEFLLAIGLLGGYPVGAQNIAQSCQSGLLDKADAERMVAFCNNAGPSFIFGIVAPLFSRPEVSWLLWGIHIISALIVGAVIPACKSNGFRGIQKTPVPFTQLLESSVRVMAVVCSWVVLFRMTLTFLTRWILWAFPVTVQVCIAGILELSNGCLQLQHIESEGLRFLLASAFLSFGGLCVTFQTVSVFGGLSLRRYFPGKLLQTALSTLLAMFVQKFFLPEDQIDLPAFLFLILLLICILLAACFRASKKRSSIPAPLGV